MAVRVVNFADGFTSTETPENLGIPASNVSFAPAGGLSSTNVQAAIVELVEQKGEASGIATLDAQGKVPLAQIPAMAITNVFVVADLAERDELEVEEGDVAKVLDDGDGNVATFIYSSTGWEVLQSDAALQLHIDDASTHGVSGDIVGTTDAQVLTNKDFDGGSASNTSRLTVPKNTKANLDGLTRKEGTLVYATDQAKAYVDNGTSLIPVGSGSGGSLNYILNPDAENDTTGWVTYADAAGAQPVDGTGGSPNVTWTRSTSSPLRGDGSFLFTKDAANRQGQGASYDFTIDSADQAKVMQISFDYAIASGTYATGDLTCYIIDVTNNVVIQPSAFQIENVGVNSTTRLTFQTASNSTSYRLCFHVASTSSSAYSLKFDNIVLGPQVVPMGAPVTDRTRYTPGVNNTTGMVERNGTWKQVGDEMVMSGSIRFTGTGVAVASEINLPSGYSIDLTKLNDTSSLTSIQNGIGFWGWYDDAGSQAIDDQFVRVLSATSFQLVRASNTVFWNTFANADKIFWEVRVPIVGWSSSTVVSSSANTRVIALQATGNPSNSIGGTFGTMTWSSVTTRINKGGISFNPSTGGITLPVPGTYKFSAVTQVARTSGSATQYLALEVRNTTTSTSYGLGAAYWLTAGAEGNSVNGETLVEGNAGDVVVFRIASQGTGLSYANTLTGTFINVEYLNGPSQIAASEVVAFVGTATNSLALTGGTTNITTASVQKDSHVGWTGSTYITPAPGDYEVQLAAASNIATYAVFVDGVAALNLFTVPVNSYIANGSAIIPNLRCGQVISFRCQATLTLASGFMSIKRLGGVG